MATKEVMLNPYHVRAYRFIEKYIRKNLYSPTIAEIAKGAHCTPRHAYRLVNDLTGLGYIMRAGAKQQRSIRIQKPMR